MLLSVAQSGSSREPPLRRLRLYSRGRRPLGGQFNALETGMMLLPVQTDLLAKLGYDEMQISTGFSCAGKAGNSMFTMIAIWIETAMPEGAKR